MASITVEEMRLIVRDMYPGEGWKFRVMNLMKSNQIIAIYAKKVEDDKKKIEEETRNHQMTLFEFPEFGDCNEKIYTENTCRNRR